MTIHRIASIACISSVAIMLITTTAHAQPFGLGPGMMMGPGMMTRGMCHPAVAGFAGWRINQLERLIRPTDAQRSKFEELKAASDKAAEIMRQACPTDIPATALGRMEVMEKRVDAMAQSIKTMRPAFESFYAALNDEQKARLDSSRGRFRRGMW